MTEDVSANPAADLDQALRATLDPVRQHLATIDARIAEVEAELASLREVRRRAASIVRVLDPEEPRPGPKKDTRVRPDRDRTISPDTVELIAAALRARFDPEDDLVAMRLGTDPEFARAIRSNPGDATAQKVSKALRELQDRGAVRLDRVGLGAKANRAKVFRLTESRIKEPAGEDRQNGQP